MVPVNGIDTVIHESVSLEEAAWRRDQSIIEKKLQLELNFTTSTTLNHIRLWVTPIYFIQLFVFLIEGVRKKI